MFLQKTIRKKAIVSGIGVHSGKECTLTFLPAPVNTGIYFVRKDLPGTPHLAVQAQNVQATLNATTLGGEQFSVATIEHCVSTLSALRIDNLIIELNGPEIPIGDGSALPFLNAILSSGLFEQDQPRKYALVTKNIYFSEGDKHGYIVPYNGLRVTCTIEFSHQAIGKQILDIDINEDSFRREIAPARTFGFLKDLEALQAKGLALGGSLQNAIGLDDQRVLNPEGLRFGDEFVRHKVLDALGDLVTLGMPLMGHVILHKAGHDLMNKLIKKFIESKDCFRHIELGENYNANLPNWVADR